MPSLINPQIWAERIVLRQLAASGLALNVHTFGFFEPRSSGFMGNRKLHFSLFQKPDSLRRKGKSDIFGLVPAKPN